MVLIIINFNRTVLYRIIASFIDDSALLLLYMFFTNIINKNNSSFVYVLLLLVSFISIEICFFIKSTSLGKFIMGLKVIDKTSSLELGFIKMLIRETFGKVLSNILFIGNIYILFNDSNQGFHDKLVNSIVIEND
ncbi:RDD domain-containing protein [Clostridium tetani]|uniref:RDD domain-containing protein n=1 Tax=Clostridium tetani (strain Massachusetts / E88) TaxID=212717 RepID=Q894S9_CLOTE|nr:RDD family protein [Clostridium tetani]AAO36013.1 hypothetical protein CTC_01455 [Clostridium tetani E88]SJZ82033.1 RDD family protein [Clostridium tetani]SUY55827.1 RDD domain-containing protein [Clostridium tetani]SUY66564.1 RDD domain-containing protein [Clostridium tetani]BDR72621.1 hypothetical protein K144316041_13290 [Clostridium tetani]